MADSSSTMEQTAALMSATSDLYNVMANERNYKNQQEVQQYMRDLQQTIFQREDTAIQRRMDDMKKAGLNPNLAAGNGANAGQAIKLDAPQRQTLNLGSALDALQSYQELQAQKQNLEILKADTKARKMENIYNKNIYTADMQERILKLTDYYNAQQYLMYGDNAKFVTSTDINKNLNDGTVQTMHDPVDSKHYRDYISSNYRTILANAELAERQVGLQDVNVLMNVLSAVFGGVKLIK